MVKYALVGYDGSDSSRRAFRFAVEQARVGHGRLRVVMVLKIAEGMADGCALLMADNGEQRARDLEEELKALAPEAGPLMDVELVLGNPGDALLEQVRRHGIDHIVIGHTAHGTLARWLLGSVSGDVLARARVPVTVVP